MHAPTAPGLGADVDWDLINSSVVSGRRLDYRIAPVADFIRPLSW